MATLHSGDAQLFYEMTGSGPDVVLLHPFRSITISGTAWSTTSALAIVILQDLRGHGESDAGDGPVTMPKLADDLDRLP